MGWLTVFAYFATSWCCWACARRLRRTGASSREIWVWTLLTVSLAVLGLNKQFDLQTAFTEVGRIVAHRQGWYESRRIVQKVLIVAVGLVAVGGAVTALWLNRGSSRPSQIALAGACLILAFVTVRATSHHRVDRLLRWALLGWFRVNWLLELGGISIVLVAARMCLARRTDASRRAWARD
jgi:hypothetical protein